MYDQKQNLQLKIALSSVAPLFCFLDVNHSFSDMFGGKKHQQKWAFTTLSVFFVVYILSIYQVDVSMYNFDFKSTFSIMFPFYLSVICPLRSDNAKSIDHMAARIADGTEMIIVVISNSSKAALSNSVTKKDNIRIVRALDSNENIYNSGIGNSNGKYVFFMINDTILANNSKDSIETLLKTSNADVIELKNGNEDIISDRKRIEQDFLNKKLGWDFNNKFIKRSAYMNSYEKYGTLIDSIEDEKQRRIIQMSCIYLTSSTYKHIRGNEIIEDFSDNITNYDLNQKEYKNVTNAIFNLFIKDSHLKKSEIQKSVLFNQKSQSLK